MEDQERLSALPKLLLPWFQENARDLPWRRDREPYHVWLSEIMLQQTRVETVKAYYLRFLAALPDIPALASAPTEQLYKLWEGLGYYSRVRNLQTAAKQIVGEHQGCFPRTYEEIRRLKGIGDYTAGAIASICMELPEPAIDGNVLRVLTRLNRDPRPIDREKTKTELREALRTVYPIGSCGDFTQALMELGAVVCVPNGAPDCAACPLREICLCGSGGWEKYPVKSPKKPRRIEKMTVFILHTHHKTAIRKRDAEGLLANLWELPYVPGYLTEGEAAELLTEWGVCPQRPIKRIQRTHVFTHVEWHMRCYEFLCAGEPERFTWATETELSRELALPTAFRKLMNETI